MAKGFVIGTRFHSASVIRLADAKPIHLAHTIKADGRWRVFAFANCADPADRSSPIQRLCEYLIQSETSPLQKYTPVGKDIDVVIDVRVIFQQTHRDLDLARMPQIGLPEKGRYGLVDYEKLFCADLNRDIFDLREIDRNLGCMVIVRPDQYVAHILPLHAHQELVEFFDRFMIAHK